MTQDIWAADSFQCSISFWSTAISIKSTVAWLYCTHTLYVMGYLYYTELRKVLMTIQLATVIWLAYFLPKSFELKVSNKTTAVLALIPTIVLALTPYCTINYCQGDNLSYCIVKSFDVWLHWEISLLYSYGFYYIVKNMWYAKQKQLVAVKSVLPIKVESML